MVVDLSMLIVSLIVCAAQIRTIELELSQWK